MGCEHRPGIPARALAALLGAAGVLFSLVVAGQPAFPDAPQIVTSPSGMSALVREQIASIGQGFKTIQAGTNTGSLSLAWNRSPDVSAVGYRIYWGVGSGNYTNSAAVGNTTNCTMSGLAIGVPYYFAATAYDSAGLESPFSNEAYGVVPWPAPVLSIRPYVYIVEGTLVPNRTNRVQDSRNLTNWSTVMLFVGGTNGFFSLLATNNVPTRYFRVKVE